MPAATTEAPIAVPGPSWVVAEMPPGYQNRVAEIERIMADLEEMGQFGRLLYEVGPELGEVVRNLFAAMKLDTAGAGTPQGIAVQLDAKRRILFHSASATGTIQRRDSEVARVFELMHEAAEDADRVVLVTNADPSKPLEERAAALTPDALAFLTRMGAGHVTASTLFALWKQLLGDPARARAQVERLYSSPPGTFELSAAAR